MGNSKPQFLFNIDRGLPCISLWRPWATWVQLGWKSIETRTHQRFRCLDKRRIGIHAAMKWDREAVATAGRHISDIKLAQTDEWLTEKGGRIICTAFVQRYAMLRGDDSSAALIDCKHTERFGLFLTDVEAVPDIPSAHVKGGQGIFYVRGLEAFVPEHASREAPCL